MACSVINLVAAKLLSRIINVVFDTNEIASRLPSFGSSEPVIRFAGQLCYSRQNMTDLTGFPGLNLTCTFICQIRDLRWSKYTLTAKIVALFVIFLAASFREEVGFHQ